jgi:hypothetical protein
MMASTPASASSGADSSIGACAKWLVLAASSEMLWTGKRLK